MEHLTVNPVLLTEGIATESNQPQTATAADGTAAPRTQSPFANQSFLLMMVVFLLVLYFFMIRPQSKKQKETQRMLASLEKGDRVVTSSGIFGTIDTVKENSFILKLNDNVKVEFAKYAVTQVLEKKNPAPQPEAGKPRFPFFGRKKADQKSNQSDAETQKAQDKQDGEKK